MTKRLMLAFLCLTISKMVAHAADPLTLCNAGAVCWIDRSGGTAFTELRFRAEGGEKVVTINPGITSFDFAEAVRASGLVPSEWLCVQGRQRATDGTLSLWFISDKEGVCNQTAAVLPPVDPAPPVPPSPQPVPVPEIFSAVTNRNGVLSFEYAVAECKRGVQQGTSALKDGRRTITLTCRK